MLTAEMMLEVFAVFAGSDDSSSGPCGRLQRRQLLGRMWEASSCACLRSATTGEMRANKEAEILQALAWSRWSLEVVSPPTLKAELVARAGMRSESAVRVRLVNGIITFAEDSQKHALDSYHEKKQSLQCEKREQAVAVILEAVT